MALCSRHLRRVLSLSSSSIIKHQRPLSTPPAIPPPSSLSSLTAPNSPNPNLDLALPHRHGHLSFQSRLFRSPSNFNDNEEIGPDTILFEGCDYNHWLITMDFPKDPRPTPEEMVETYVQTLAKVVGSVEEAKKRMYACSTTTYHGFQAEVTEEMSEKFKGLPGVVFVLPDSYIDPVNKEYGGDKYINGTIIPRPPPVQYGRTGGRYGDRNREFNRNRPRDPPPFRGNAPYDNQGHAPQYNSPPPQNYSPTGPRDRRDPMPMNSTPGGRDNYQGERREPTAPYQANYQQGDWGNEHQQGQRDIPPGDRRGYSPPGQMYNRDNSNYAPPQAYGQGTGGTYGQGAGGNYGQGAGGAHGREIGSSYGQSQPGSGADQRYSQVEQRNNMQGDQRTYPTMGSTGTDQGRY